MIAGGVSFQPGAPDDRNKINPNAPNGTQEGVQEAIKVLSLRLPKVVGAQAIAPSPLLNSQGSGGNSRVDSIVAQVMQKYFPTGDAPQAQAPGAPMPQQESGASFGGLRQQDVGENRDASPWRNIPNIIAGPPMTPPPEAPFTGGPAKPNTATWDGGSNPLQNNMIAPLPDLKQHLDWLQPSDREQPPLI